MISFLLFFSAIACAVVIDNSTRVQVFDTYINETSYGSPLFFGFKTMSDEVLTLDQWTTYYGCNTTSITLDGVPKQPPFAYKAGQFWQAWNFNSDFFSYCVIDYAFQAADYTFGVQLTVWFAPPTKKYQIASVF